jgi:hypothetical protein
MIGRSAYVRGGFAAVLLGAFAGTGAACSSGSGGSSSTDAVLTQSASLVSNPDDITVTPTQLIMPASTHADMLSHKAGDLLIGDRGVEGAVNQTGFVRKVVSVTQTGSNIVVTTTPATILDAVKQGELSGTIDLSVPASTSDYRLYRKDTNIKLVDFSGKQLINWTGNVPVGTKTVGFTATATVNTGTLNFMPKLDVGAKIEPDFSDLLGSLKEAHLIATGTLDAKLVFDVAVKLDTTLTGDDIAKLIASELTKSTTTTLAEYDLDLGKLHIGFIPVPIKGHFKADVSCDFKWGGEVAVQVGGHANASISAGYKFDGTSATPVFDHSVSFDQIGPTWTTNADVLLKCSLTPTISLDLFDMAAGDITATAYAEMTAGTTCNAGTFMGTLSGEAFAGANATAHAKVDALGFKYEKTCSLFDVESTHASFSQSWPLTPKGTCSMDSTTSLPSTKHDAPADSCFGNSSSSGGDPSIDPGSDAGTGDDSGATTGDDSGTTTGDDGGSADAGETGEACVPPGGTPPTGWTCAASKYGDCTCDCSCGAPDVDCALGACAGCTHDVCTTGAALSPSCTTNGACIMTVCASDSTCCDSVHGGLWDSSCVSEAKTLCGAPCP